MAKSPIPSIIAASASSVGKTFLIGMVGYLASRFPKSNPLLPPSMLSTLSRMIFTMLMLPLIYEGVASSVKLEDLESLYPVILISWGILGISFLVTMALGYLPCFRLSDEGHKKYFTPLCIASTFPNIVALPIMIFPTLCEYEVAHDLIDVDMKEGRRELEMMDDGSSQEGEYSYTEMIDICQNQTNAIVYTYFLGWSIIFWSIGQQALVNLAREQLGNNNNEEEELNERRRRGNDENCSFFRKIMIHIKDVIMDVLKSPGFVLLILAFITACIPPLQRALFEPGGSLRVFGSALESLASAGSTFATVIVAASLAQKEDSEDSCNDDESNSKIDSENTNNTLVSNKNKNNSENDGDDSSRSLHNDEREDTAEDAETDQNCDKNMVIEKNIQSEKIGPSAANMSTPTQRFLFNLRIYCRKISNPITTLKSLPSDDFKIYTWQIMSRLLITPTLVYFILVWLDCSGVLDSVPLIARLILLINSALPGALIVVVLLKAEGLTDVATAVSKTYFPTYALSVFTVAMWASIGLMTWRPESSICQRWF